MSWREILFMGLCGILLIFAGSSFFASQEVSLETERLREELEDVRAELGDVGPLDQEIIAKQESNVKSIEGEIRVLEATIEKRTTQVISAFDRKASAEPMPAMNGIPKQLEGFIPKGREIAISRAHQKSVFDLLKEFALSEIEHIDFIRLQNFTSPNSLPYQIRYRASAKNHFRLVSKLFNRREKGPFLRLDHIKVRRLEAGSPLLVDLELSVLLPASDSAQ